MYDSALESDKAYEKIQDALAAYNSLLDEPSSLENQVFFPLYRANNISSVK